MRDIFQLHFGKAREATPRLKELQALERDAGLTGTRLLADVTGPYHTLVVESEVGSLAELEARSPRWVGARRGARRTRASHRWCGRAAGRSFACSSSGTTSRTSQCSTPEIDRVIAVVVRKWFCVVYPRTKLGERVENTKTTAVLHQTAAPTTPR